MNQIDQKLAELRLNGMNKRWKSLTEMRQHHDLNFSEGLELLLQSELEERKNNRFDRLKDRAKFRYQSSIEELTYAPERGLSKEQVSRLAMGDYIKNGESILITGATGCGKSFIASGFGHHACAQGYKVLYFNFLKLMKTTKLARVDGSIHKLFENISKQDLLILDDFGLTCLDNQQQLDFMEVIEDRHGKKSTIIASQLPVASWYDIIGEATIADAILDRLVHSSHRIELKGNSLRKIM
jgi:DNA replication protein DnaC